MLANRVGRRICCSISAMELVEQRALCNWLKRERYEMGWNVSDVGMIET